MSRRKRTKRSQRPPPAAIAVNNSDNMKTGPVAVTYAAQESCPVTCKLYGAGCYAEAGPMGVITARLNAAAVGMTPEQIACHEADAIDRLPGNSDLRLHAVGDCRTDAAAVLVAAAATRYLDRSGATWHYGAAGREGDVCRAWNYTHAWKTVRRSAWGAVSVLASCETWDEVFDALDCGYAPAIVVAEWENGDRAWQMEDCDGKTVTVVPCPFQTKQIQCVNCRLCLDDDKLKADRRVIAFKAHGSRRASVVRTLNVLNS